MSEWIKNEGVKPVVGDKPFEVELRNGVSVPSSELKLFDWLLLGDDFDIVKWRFTQ